MTDAYLKKADIRYLDAQNLLHNYLEHSRDILKKHYEENLINTGYRILAYATACDEIEWEDPHPAIQKDLDEIINHFSENREQINRFFTQLSESGVQNVVSALKPDLVGEYLFLYELENLIRKKRNNWMVTLLKQEYSHSFFAMCLVDWPEESEILCDMLSDRMASAEQCTACAEVFRRAVREAQTVEQNNYAAKIKTLDYNHSASVLKKYTDAVRFIFEHAAKETRAECVALINEIEWAYYLCKTNEEQLNYADACSDVASVYDDIGNFEKALEYSKKALAIREKVLGTEHPSTAATYNNIALVYKAMGDYANALEYNLKALAIREKVLGIEHPDTAATYNNIADIYQAMGDYDMALEYADMALAIYEKVLGTEHPDTATSYNNIAGVYQERGDYFKALDFYNKALAIREKVLGIEHRDTAATYNNIAVAYQAMGDYPKALDFYNKALAVSEKVLGTEHPSTAATYNNIAGVYQVWGDYPKALDFYKKALVIHEKMLGTKHPDTAATYKKISIVYQAMGNYSASLKYALKIEQIYEVVLEDKHSYIKIPNIRPFLP